MRPLQARVPWHATAHAVPMEGGPCRHGLPEWGPGGWVACAQQAHAQPEGGSEVDKDQSVLPLFLPRSSPTTGNYCHSRGAQLPITAALQCMYHMHCMCHLNGAPTWPLVVALFPGECYMGERGLREVHTVSLVPYVWMAPGGGG